ncbi:hypothetical protein JHK86_003322 [Glycine max]|nr:hypothetical protein JHK86_003322 [Glycine max]
MLSTMTKLARYHTLCCYTLLLLSIFQSRFRSGYRESHFPLSFSSDSEGNILLTSSFMFYCWEMVSVSFGQLFYSNICR